MNRLYFKISNGNTTYFTELLINDFGAYITSKHWEENNQLNDKLFPLKNGTLNFSEIQFHISI